MLPELAGVLRRHGPVTESDRRALRSLLGPDAHYAESGPLAVAWTGEAAVAGAALTVLGGRRYAGPLPPPAELTVPADLRGDFALLLWDGRQGVVARDHMGQHGLYYSDDGGRLVFANEVVRVLDLLPRRPAPRRDAVPLWIGSYGFPADVTLYAGVHRVESGCLLPLDPRRPRPPRRWWDPGLEPLDVTAEEAAERILATLRTAVGRRCRPDERTGVLLSGGLDSSSVAGVSSLVEHRPRRAYSGVFPDHPSIDESKLIADVCAQVGLASTRIVVRSGSVFAGGVPYIERWALPPVSPNLFFWLPLVERAAADGMTSLIDGEGGDELFGLSPYLLSDLLARGRFREAVGLVRIVPGADGNPTREQIRAYLRRWGLPGLAPAWAHAVSRGLRGPAAYVPRWMRPATARDYMLHVDGAEWKRGRGRRWQRYLRWASGTGLGPSLLYEHVRQRAQMAGMEARHPLPDADVVQLMLRLPPELAYDPDRTRPLLRRAVHGLIPDSVRLRPDKSTFDAVFQAALTGPDLPVARTLLGAGARMGEYVDLEIVERELLAGPPPEGSRDRPLWAVLLWRLMTGEAWLRSLEDPGAVRRTFEQVGIRAADVRLDADTPPA
jgi:asparagine synthase (glutamine-hydrolysing)